jgi:MFS transporter, DHA2 family, methylenomycin A resistance protein
MSLHLHQVRGLSALATGLTFLPMMLIGAILTPFSARAAVPWIVRPMWVSKPSVHAG